MKPQHQTAGQINYPQVGKVEIRRDRAIAIVRFADGHSKEAFVVKRGKKFISTTFGTFSFFQGKYTWVADEKITLELA